MSIMNKRKQITAILAAMILMLTAILPICTARAEDQKGVVKGGWLILRGSPSFYGAILSSYPSGTTVTIKGKSGAWYSVVAPDGLTGYMLGDYLQVTSGGGGVPSGTTAYVTSTNGLNVRLRSGPGKGYSIIAAYAPGTKCTVLSAGNNWSRIQIGSLTGYMMTRFLTSAYVGPTPTPKPQPSPSGEYQVYVTSQNGKGVNLRSGPSKAFGSIGFYSVGTPAWMITKGTSWSPVNGAYVISGNGKSVNLRSAPSLGSSVIRSYKPGTRLTVITRGVDWCFILIDGRYGYMMRQYIYDGGTTATQTDLGF